jgi:hypothetical protein
VERHLPEKAFAKTLEKRRNLKSTPALELPKRPLRLLQSPELLQRSGSTLVHPRHGKRWNVLRWEGPERISGEWWSSAFSRDYYRVMTDQGELLWIYVSSVSSTSGAREYASVGPGAEGASRLPPHGVASGGSLRTEVETETENWTDGSSALKPREPHQAFYLHGFFD